MTEDEGNACCVYKAEYTCESDTDCPDDRFCLGDVCVDPCPILTPCQGSLRGGSCVAREHRPLCECPPGTLANSETSLCIPINATENGCEYEGRLYAQGEVRYSGQCEEQCRCGSDGAFTCGPITCPSGLFPAGQHANQDLCIELRNRPGTDECCVVVVCADSLAKPSVLTSPTLALPSPSQIQEPMGGHEVWALTGRAVSHDKPQPITDKQHQQQTLKDLEEELNKNGDKKKAIEDKLKDKSKPSEVTSGVELDNTTQTTNNTQEEEMFDIEPMTTLAPLRSPEDTDDIQAVVVEYDDGGEPIHRITLQEQVDVVTESITPMEEETVTKIEEDNVMMVTNMEDDDVMMVTEENATEPNTTTMMPDLDLNLAREGKQVPDDDNSTHQVQPATEPSNSKVEGKAGVGALKVRQVNHNSSTIFLPSTKGGELYYKSLESTEWLQKEVATGQDSVVLRGLVPNTQYTLKWSGNFGGSAKVTIDTEDGCRTDNNNHSYGLSEEWTEGCQQRCSCRPGGRVDCQPRCIFVAGDIKDPQCTEKPAQEDPECCVAYDCSSGGESEASSPITPSLWLGMISARTYEGGYVAEYREEGVGSRLSQEPWKREEVPAGEQPPKITVETLKPNTLYEVRVSIYDDVEEGRLGESTETINFRTDAGCEHGNSSHAVGEFFNGCEERCMCLATGAVRCFERCTLPYIRTGSFKGDPFCSEKQNETDECCAIVHCTSSKREYTPCTNVVCGPNAKCISSAPTTGEHSLIVIESDLSPGYCRCNDGFIGDASDLITGCIPDPSAGQREGNCTFKNSTYRPGDVFYDECDYRCSCNNNTEIECEPRCEFPHKDGSEPEPGCEYLPDPDDECCKLRVCNSTSAAATDAARAPSLPSDGCTKGNVTYARNEKFYNGCETQCICMGFGDVSCFPRCPPLKVVSESPKRCETLPDPLDPCCSITVCDEETPDVMKANITELEDEMMKNMTAEEKEVIKKQMMNLTDTEKAMMIKEIMNISEAQEDSMMNFEKKNRAEDLGSHDLHILEVSPLNTTTVMITIAVSDAVMQQILSSEEQHFTVLYSPDSLTWSERKIPVSDIKVENFTKVIVYVGDLQPSTPYQFRVAFQEFVSSTSKARLMDGTIDRDGREPVDIDISTMCFNNGSYYKPGEEFYEGCSNSCICTESLEVHCAAIECPVTFGLDIIDPDCFEWDVDPDYIPTPPKCCPQMKCIQTYACQYMGQTFNNYDEVPRELTGCSQVCTCNYGNVTCRPLCEEVPPIPPPHLNCAHETAILVTLPGEPCCRSWQCPSHSIGSTSAVFPLPPVSVLGGSTASGFIPMASPNFGADEIPEPHISSLDAGTLHLVFSTPSLYEGLPGKLVIRYTNESSLYPDPNTWYEEVVLPESSLISQNKWEHIITDLQPATQYTIQIVLTIHGAEPKLSPIVSYTTMTEATTPSTTTPLPRLDIDAELYASAITKTSAKVSWRGFNEFELQYIDGVQVKYTEKDKLIPRFSQLFHRDNNQMDVRDLQPGHTYTVDLVFISHPNQTTQVSSTRPITFSTLPEEDLYAFEIEVQAGKVSSQTAELFYSGVPEPEEKFVNVYRVVYLREDERVDAQAFKIPKTGQDRKIFLENLKPDVEYKVWIEAFLSNGRKKQSNVITITTRAGQLPKPERSEVDPSAQDTEGSGEDYYPAMVAVAIIAAIACAAFLGLLVILLRRNKSQRKANINSGNNAAYDNPSYKVGDNTYDMEMNGIKSSGNGATYTEDP
ncbi:hypothetical protein Pmani_033123 [Petrolisthes manimaculis]|uniref:Epidermal cell surface receptor n=1 Tax=Petrolisthes manimaculis TaxID=1843537 RepID=A0AAE1NQD6_9EUCA|nr:hypothetical protein Pmani_033123 [Petrolisthes manimaculis]